MNKADLREAFRTHKIVVLGGGFSSERSVSTRSAKGVFESLVRLGYDVDLRDPLEASFSLSDCPIVFNMLHGRYGEDGAIQSYMDWLGIVYTGSSVAASQLSMNKIKTKWLLRDLGLPTAAFCVGMTSTVPEHNLSFPLILKPIDEGSSVGVELIDSPEELELRVQHHHQRYGVYMLEQFIEGKEITVGILVSESGEIETLPILELRSENRFYDYEAKYIVGKTRFILPAELEESVARNCQALGRQVFFEMGCTGFGRVDMMVCPQNGPFILEVNTLPGMTETSDLPAQAKHKGLSYDQLVEAILWSAYPKFVERNTVRPRRLG